MCQRYKEETCDAKMSRRTHTHRPLAPRPPPLALLFKCCYFETNFTKQRLAIAHSPQETARMPTPSHRSKTSSKVSKKSEKRATKKARVKRTKSVTKTKRPLSSYMLWLQKEGRAAVKAKYPQATFGETGKQCGVMWRALSEETRTKYTAEAEKLKRVSQQAQQSIAAGDSDDEDDDDDDDEEEDEDDGDYSEE